MLRYIEDTLENGIIGSGGSSNAQALSAALNHTWTCVGRGQSATQTITAKLVKRAETKFDDGTSP